jgi:hypothetical protein
MQGESAAFFSVNLPSTFPAFFPFNGGGGQGEVRRFGSGRQCSHIFRTSEQAVEPLHKGNASEI